MHTKGDTSGADLYKMYTRDTQSHGRSSSAEHEEDVENMLDENGTLSPHWRSPLATAETVSQEQEEASVADAKAAEEQEKAWEAERVVKREENEVRICSTCYSQIVVQF